MQTSKVCGRWAAPVVRVGVLWRSGNDRLIESGVHVQCAKPAMSGGTPASNLGRTRRTASPLRPTAAGHRGRVGRVTSITAHPDGLIKVGPVVPPHLAATLCYQRKRCQYCWGNRGNSS